MFKKLLSNSDPTSKFLHYIDPLAMLIFLKDITFKEVL